jgi:hypothetical protein
MIAPEHAQLSVTRQCELVGISRVTLVLPAKGKKRLKPALDARDRRAVPEDALVRLKANGAAPAATWPLCRAQASASFNAPDGPSGRGAAAEHVAANTPAPGLSVSAKGQNRAGPPGLVCRSDVPADGAWLFVSRCDHGLARSQGAVVASVNDTGYGVVSRPWKRQSSATVVPRSSTPIRAANSRAATGSMC